MGSLTLPVKELKGRGKKTETKQVATEKPQLPQTKSAVEEMYLLRVRKHTHEADIEREKSSVKQRGDLGS